MNVGDLNLEIAFHWQLTVMARCRRNHRVSVGCEIERLDRCGETRELSDRRRLLPVAVEVLDKSDVEDKECGWPQ